MTTTGPKEVDPYWASVVFRRGSPAASVKLCVSGRLFVPYLPNVAPHYLSPNTSVECHWFAQAVKAVEMEKYFATLKELNVRYQVTLQLLFKRFRLPHGTHDLDPLPDQPFRLYVAEHADTRRSTGLRAVRRLAEGPLVPPTEDEFLDFLQRLQEYQNERTD